MTSQIHKDSNLWRCMLGKLMGFMALKSEVEKKLERKEDKSR